MTERAQKKSSSRTVRRWVGRGIGAIVVVAVIAAIAYSVRPKPQRVDVATVTQGTLSITLDDDGRTRVRNRYVVSAPISGRVLRMGLSPGDEIREGQALATLVPIQTPLLDGRTMAEAEARAHGAGAAVKRAIASVEGARTALELAKTDASRATALEPREPSGYARRISPPWSSPSRWRATTRPSPTSSSAGRSRTTRPRPSPSP
jgi:HlyD family secretion protein